MWQLLVVTVALVQGHPVEFKKCWDNAKAVADVTDRYRHGLCDAATYRRVRFQHLTLHEEIQYYKDVERRLRQGAHRPQENETIIKRIEEKWERSRWRQPVGPPPPPDTK